MENTALNLFQVKSLLVCDSIEFLGEKKKLEQQKIHGFSMCAGHRTKSTVVSQALDLLFLRQQRLLLALYLSRKGRLVD